MVNDDSIRNDGVSRVLRAPLRLAHPISNYFATAKLDLFSVNGEVLLNLNNEIGIGQPDSVSHGRTEHFCVCLSGELHRKGVQEFKELQEFSRNRVARPAAGLQPFRTHEKS